MNNNEVNETDIEINIRANNNKTDDRNEIKDDRSEINKGMNNDKDVMTDLNDEIIEGEINDIIILGKDSNDENKIRVDSNKEGLKQLKEKDEKVIIRESNRERRNELNKKIKNEIDNEILIDSNKKGLKQVKEKNEGIINRENNKIMGLKKHPHLNGI